MFTSCLGMLLGAAESVACVCSHHVPLWEAVRTGKGLCPALSGCGGEGAGTSPRQVLAKMKGPGPLLSLLENLHQACGMALFLLHLSLGFSKKFSFSKNPEI